LKSARPEIPEENIFSSVVEDTAAPAEIADAYKKIEARTSPL